VLDAAGGSFPFEDAHSAIARGLSAAGAPKAVMRVAIELFALLPEMRAAVRAARANRLQASIGSSWDWTPRTS
jgi:Ca2+/H+ antiporter